MARIPTLSDGQPLTYEVINKIIEKLGSIKDPTQDQSQDILVYNRKINPSSKDKIQIVSAEKGFNFTASKIDHTETVQFEKEFSKMPVVVASVIDPAKGGSPDMIAFTIFDQTLKDFKIKLKVLKSSKKEIPLRISYIAIGTSGTSK